MIQLFLVYALAVGSITAAPQFLDFTNGGVGVNFGGYSARAGLGGLLTGNAADGGLSASAGTPFGQRAAAGLGGSVNGNAGAAGGLYAGAQANNEIGASAALGGSTGTQPSGFLGAESHSNGNSVTKTLIKDSPSLTVPTTIQKTVRTYQVPAVTVVKTYNRPLIRKIKHYRPAARRAGLYKQITFVPLVSQRFGGDEQQVNVGNPTTYNTVQKDEYPVVTKEVRYNPTQFLNIPIGILRSIQDSLQPIAYSKQVSYSG